MTISWKPSLEDTGQPLYRAIAHAIAADINTGVLTPGDQLPTHRDLADALGVAIGTVTRAYLAAEQRGLVHGQGRRGTFVGKIRTENKFFSPLGTSSPGMIDLSVNYPVYCEDPDLSAGLKAVSRRAGLQELLYFSSGGRDERFRHSGSRWLETCGMRAGPEQIILTNGAQHAISVILLAIARPGDIIATAELTYPGIRESADMLDLKLAGLPLDGEGILPDAFDALCRRRRIRALYCVPTLQNPTNVTASPARRGEIARIAEKHDVLILEDDIHCRLLESRPGAIRQHAPESTFYISSIAKTVVSGLRVAFVVPPKAYYQRVTETLQALTWMASPLPFEVFTCWLENGVVEQTIVRKRAEAMARQRIAKEMLGPFLVGDQSPSHYIWLPLPAEWTPDQFAVAALREGVGISGADIFAVATGHMANAVRVCLGAAETQAALRTALGKLRLLLEHKPNDRALMV